MAQDTQAIENSLLELWNTGNPDVARQLYGDNAERYDPNRQEATRGPEEIGRYVAEIRTGYPDFKLEINEAIAEGDRLAIDWTVTGTHKGEFLGIPATGKRINIRGMSLERIESGKIVEDRVYFDRLTMLQQLGVPPESLEAQAKSAAG